MCIIHLKSKHMRTSPILFLLMAFASFFLNACNKEAEATTETIEATIAPNETYTYRFAPVNAPDAPLEISTQAQHFQISQVVLDANTNEPVFTYTPAKDFIGTELVHVKPSGNHPPKECGQHNPPPPHPKGGNCEGKKHKPHPVNFVFKITVKGENNPE